MSMTKRCTLHLTAMFLMAVLSFQTIVPAHAAFAFSDIAPGSPYQECLDYLAERQIVTGTGNNCFSPDVPVTVQQWAIMLCRAYGLDIPSDGEFGLGCINQCLKNGWLNITAVSEPETQMCLGYLLESAFSVIDLPIYSYELYPDGTQLSKQENLLRVGKELGLCEQDDTAVQIVSRKEAAMLLYQILTRTFEIVPPPSPLPVQDHVGGSLNQYYLELRRVPQPILQAFQSRGWQYIVDFTRIAQYSQEFGMPCIGVTSYSAKKIYVSDADATLHEMGHFLHDTIGFPKEFEKLYVRESQAAGKLLRQYAQTNAYEYFADCFVYWISYRNEPSKMEKFQTILPDTYRFFAVLEENGWTVQAGKKAVVKGFE